MVSSQRRVLVASHVLAGIALLSLLVAQSPVFTAQVAPAVSTFAASCDSITLSAEKVEAGKTLSIKVKMKNTGTTTWQTPNTYGYEVYNEATNMTQLFKVTSAYFTNGQQSPVKPNQTGTLSLSGVAPSVPGEYPVWIGIADTRYGLAQGTCVKRVIVTKNNTAVKRAAPIAECQSIEGVPATVAPGQKFSATVRFKNAGAWMWGSDKALGDYGFESYQLNSAGKYVQLWASPSAYFDGGIVAPQGVGTLRVTSTAPTAPGTYSYEWQVAEGGTLASTARCSATVTVASPVVSSSSRSSVGVSSVSSASSRVSSSVSSIISSQQSVSSRSSAGSSMADVSLDISVPANVAGGSTFYPSFIVKNAGPAATDTINFVVTAPSGVSLVVNDADKQYCTVSGSAMRCTLPALPSDSNNWINTIGYKVDTTFCGKQLPVMAVATTATPDPAPANNLAQKTLTVTCDDAVNAASCVSSTVPSSVVVGQEFTGVIRMKNTGTKAWTGNKYYLGIPHPQLSSWSLTNAGASWAGWPTAVVAPGQEVDIPVKGRATAVGTFPFDWRMVQDDVQIFGDVCAKNITVTAHAACNDDIDNDNDGLTDMQDTGCTAVTDQSEQNGTISLSAVANNAVSTSSVTIAVGDTVVIGGTPRSVSDPANRAWFFDSVFEGACRDGGSDIWSLVCTPKTTGVSRTYMQIYQDDKPFTSNAITVTVVPKRTGSGASLCGVPACSYVNIAAVGDFMPGGSAPACIMSCTVPVSDGTSCNTLETRIPCPTGRSSSSVSVSSSSSSRSSDSSSSVSSQTSSVPALPTLNIMVQNSVEKDVVVRNQKDVSLLRMVARSDDSASILYKISFRALQGSLANGQTYSLWQDSDRDGVVDRALQSNVSPQNDRVVFDAFDNIGALIAGDDTLTLEVHTDIASSPVGNTLQLGLAVDSAESLKATDGNGHPLEGIRVDDSLVSAFFRSLIGQLIGGSTPHIIVTTARATITNYTIVSQGSLFVIKDNTPTRPHQLLGGSLGDTVLNLSFRAENEDVDVTKIRLTSSGSTATSVDRLELYKVGSTTPFAIATTAGCGSDDVQTDDQNGGLAQTFCASMESRQLIVPEGNRVGILVRPRMKNDSAGAVSGQTVAFYVPGQSAMDTVSGTGAIHARGLQSSNNLTGNVSGTDDGAVFIGSDFKTNNSSIVGQRHQVVLAKLASIANASPDTDGTAVPTGIAAIGQFKFTAAANSNAMNGLNKFTLSGVIFNVSAVNVGVDPTSFKIYNKADTSTKVSCASAGSNELTVVCSGLKGILSSSINQGDAATFVLEANVTNPNTSFLGLGASSLQVSLQSFNNTRPGTNLPLSSMSSSFGVSASHVQWLDEDTSATIFNWIEYDNTVVKSTSYKS